MGRVWVLLGFIIALANLAYGKDTLVAYEFANPARKPQKDQHLLKLDFPKNLAGQESSSVSICLRFFLNFAKSSGVINDVANISFILTNPLEGFGFIEIANMDPALWYVLFMSAESIPINSYMSICIMLNNGDGPDGLRMTTYMAYLDGQLWANNTFFGSKAIKNDFRFGSKFAVGGADNIGFEPLRGRATDVNVWKRGLTDNEMILFTTSGEFSSE